MSPNVGNFVHDLVEMAKAMEMLPEVQRELEQAKRMVEQQAQVIANREESILAKNSEIGALHSKIREAEKARDDAETMFLECDDKLSAFRRLVEGQVSAVQSLIAAQSPPAPVAPEPPSVPVQPEQVASDPQAISAPVEPIYPWGQTQEVSQPIDNPRHNYDPGPSGVTFHGDASNVDAVSSMGQREAGEQRQTTSSDGPMNDSSVVTTEPKPFFGKLYINTPSLLSLEEWLAGGGTNETYVWREGDHLPLVEGGCFWRDANGKIHFEQANKF